jgi:hypothetical protein
MLGHVARRRAARADAMLLPDAELRELHAERLQRLQLTCAVCHDAGWAVGELKAPPRARTMVALSCSQHALCLACAAAWGASEAAWTGGRVRCPASASGCRGLLPAALSQPWRAAADRRLRAQSVTDACPTCAAAVVVPATDLEAPWLRHAGGCPAWCTRCAAPQRPGAPSAGEAVACACSALPEDALPHAWSRTVHDASGAPVRKSSVSLQAVRARLARLAAGPEPFAHCPCCDVALAKTAACNQLHHCGPRAVCNACGAASLPWEGRGLPDSHWAPDEPAVAQPVAQPAVAAAAHHLTGSCGASGCPRWDADDSLRAAGFACQEGVCFSACEPCTRPDHAQGRAALHALRRARFLRRLVAEFPAAAAVFARHARNGSVPHGSVPHGSAPHGSEGVRPQLDDDVAMQG